MMMVKHPRVKDERDGGQLRVITSRWRVLLPFEFLLSCCLLSAKLERIVMVKVNE